VQLLRDLDPSRFRWRTETYEYPERRPRRRPPRGDAALPRARRRGRESRPLDRDVPGRRRPLRASREAALLYRPGPPRVQVVGAHDSGKTTHALALVAALAARGLKVGAVKHTRDEYETDVAGSDSQRHFAAGASPVVFVSGRRTGVHARHDADPSLDAVVAREMPDADVVVVEGFREAAGPKVEICRSATGRAPVCTDDPGVLAVLTDRDTPHPSAVPRLPLGEVERLVPLVLDALGLGGPR
jgi:molybdopterin-guanine dinucleotide biosynthesis protein MobB